jgi:putative peptide zinc metalloprotease protein
MGLRAPAGGPARDGSIRPRLRSGWALKQLEGEDEGDRYVLRDLRGGSFLRMDAGEAELLPLLDGKRTIAELLIETTKMLGPSGSGRLARLIADFGERGMLDGIAPTPVQTEEPGLLRRAFKMREKVFEWLPDYFERAYRHWGRFFFSGLGVTFLILLSLAGLIVFAYLIGARYGTPLVVAHHLLIGGAVFIAGRLAIVMVHELGHGMALAHYGRTTNRAGVSLLWIFPFAFVDTSESYFEPRMHRIVVSVAGPVVDFSLGALFSILCAISPKGNLRDIFFQLAFAGYVGAFFNANPFIERDGYQILCDWLREPGLRQRARQQLKQRLSGQVTGEQTNPVLARFAVAGLVWSLIGAGFVIVLASRYEGILKHYAPSGLVIAVFIVFFVVLLLPIPIALGAPMLQRARFGTREVNRVIR